MSKILIGLSAAQLLVIAFLALRVADLDARLAEATPIDAPIVAASSLTAPSPGLSAPGAEEIRAIIREELAAAPTRNAATSSAALPPPAAPLAAPTSAAIAQVGAVDRDIDAFIARGRINPKEMASLQMKMAELPPAERTKMLRRLTKAMNEGRLAGEL